MYNNLIKPVSLCICAVILFLSAAGSSFGAEKADRDKLDNNHAIVNADGTISIITERGSKPVSKNHSKKLNKKLLDEATGSEVISKRDAYSKHFLNNNGTITAYISGAPMHYLNGSSYEDIDLTIEQAVYQEYEYSSIKNSVESYFTSVQSGKGDGKLAKFTKKNSAGIVRSVEYMLRGSNPTSEEVTDNSIIYRNVFENTDLEYIVSPDKLKENIIVHAPAENYSYKFQLILDGIKPQKREDGGINFIDTDTNELLWEVSPPMAEDSSIEKKTTYNVAYELDKTIFDGHEYDQITVTLNDHEFLNNATFPIIIDPTTDLSRTYGRHIGPSGFAQSDSVFGYAYPGFVYGNLTEEFRVFLNFNLNSIPSNAIVSNATLKIIPAGTLGSSNPGSFLVKRLTSDATYSTWSSQPSTSTTNQVSITTSGMSTKLWNITNMIQEVKANNYTFYGVSLQAYPAHNYSFYYDFYNYPTLQVTYAVNNAPLLNLNSPTANTLYSEVNTSVSPSIVVSDIDNQTLTAKYYVDVEVTPRDTKTLTSTVTAQVVTFNPFNPSTLTDGNHTIKYTLTDGYVTTQQTVNIKVDKTAPAISTFSVTTTDTSINITTLATDAVAGLDPNPYRYTVDASISSWGSSTTYSKNSLTPNTTYAAKVEARDTKGHISNLTSNIYTKAQVPVLSINNPTAISLDITTTDNNPSSTLYQFISGTKYVQANGTLTTTPTWISLTAKKVTVTGLTPTTTYTFQAKAKNVSGVETALSIGAVGATFQDVPPVPTNFQASATSNIVTLSWNSVLGATSYDVEVNGVIINNNTSITYQHTQLNPATTHQYRVRAKNTVGVGNWSAMYPITTGYSVYTVTRSLNQTFNLVLSATKINNFGQHTFTVSYDPLAFDVVDLSTLTWPKELSLGTITGTGIAITQFSPGSITFTVSNAITMGNSWSGVANIIKFRAKANITSNITYIMN